MTECTKGFFQAIGILLILTALLFLFDVIQAKVTWNIHVHQSCDDVSP